MPRRTRGDGFEMEWRGDELLRDVEAAAEDAIGEMAEQDVRERTGRRLARRIREHLARRTARRR